MISIHGSMEEVNFNMASIQRRGDKYCVVYSYEDKDGSKKQKWETFSTKSEAQKRKKEIEYKQETNEFVVPTSNTLTDLLTEYIDVYGKSKWALSTYSSNVAILNNYVIPIIGDYKLTEINTRFIDRYYQSLLKLKAKRSKFRKDQDACVSPSTIREIHKILRSAFNKAVTWELMPKNPCIGATLPKENPTEREIWTVETIATALELCTDDILSLAINLAFSCCLRSCEMLGLTWDDVIIDEESCKKKRAYIFVNKELQRVTLQSLEELGNKGVKFIFPMGSEDAKSVLTLKEPKTPSSVRKIYIPETMIEILKERKKQIEELKKIYGIEYFDYNLVVCQANGRPIEANLIQKKFKKLIKENNLPPVVFYSLRHSSITYKLKWNNGDMKSVQGDSGHSSVEMIAKVYSHIIDEDRRVNAETFNDQFYNVKGIEENAGIKEIAKPDFNIKKDNSPTLNFKASGRELFEEEKEQDKTQNETEDLINKLRNNPDALNLLKLLLK